MLDRLPKATLGADLFGAVPEPVATRRARATNKPLSRVDQSTAIGRRIADLFRSYVRAMNAGGCIAEADALRAAELVAGAEQARVQLLAGKGDADQVVRLENLAARAVKKLGIDPRSAAKPKKTLAEYARERASDPNKASAA